MILMNLKNKIDLILRWSLIFIISFMSINVLWQIFTRFVLKNPSSITEELARYMLVWLGILGASYVAGQKMHLAIDLLSTKLEGIKKSFLVIIIQASIFLFSFFVMVIGGVRLVQITLSLKQISAALQIPLGYVYLVLPISGLLIMFYSTVFIIEQIRIIKSTRISK